MPNELPYATWIRITGLPWSEAQKRGYTTGTAAANIALQQKLLSGWRPGGATASAAPAQPAAPDYGAYTPIIQNLQQQEQSLPSIYQPQVQALQATIPTIQKQYQSLLEQLRQRTTQQQQQLQQQQTTTVGTEQARAAAAGVAPAYGTPEMAAIQQIQTGYQQSIADLLAQAAQQETQTQLAGTQAEQSVQAQINQILGQQEQARQQLLAQIAQAQAEAAQAAEERRRWEAEFAENVREAKASEAAAQAGGTTTGGLTDKEQVKRWDDAIKRGQQDLQKGIPWGVVWNRIKAQFPDIPNEAIDAALGVEWREAGAFEKIMGKKTTGGGKQTLYEPSTIGAEIQPRTQQPSWLQRTWQKIISKL